MCVNRIDTLVPKAKTLFCRRHPQSHSLLSRPFFSFASTVKDKTNKISFCMPSCAVAAPLTHRLIWCVVVLNRESLSSLFHVWQWLVIEAIVTRVYLSVDTATVCLDLLYFFEWLSWADQPWLQEQIQLYFWILESERECEPCWKQLAEKGVVYSGSTPAPEKPLTIETWIAVQPFVFFRYSQISS